jgi:hypothetical protein
MPQKIYFGNVEIINTRTRQTQTMDRQVFKEQDTPNDTALRSTVLRQFKPNERANLQIVKLCFDTAKQIGQTFY